MEYIIISDSEMKITLSQKELDIYRIDSEDFSMGNDTQRHAFRKVLSDACRESGFSGSFERMIVQMYPIKKGGCEIFITRIDPSLSLAGSTSTEAQKKQKDDIKSLLFTFSSFSQLSAVCRQLSTVGSAPKSSLYISDGGTYYLILDDISAGDDKYSPFSFIREFSKSTSQIPVAYLTEYCKPICEENAVTVIGSI